LFVNALQILQGHGGSIVKDLQRSVAPYTATGDTIKSIMFSLAQSGEKVTLQILGREYIMALETGRKATPQYTKPSVQFVDRIKRYLAAKGEDTNFAYAIAKSIHQKGTQGHPGVITGVINDGLIERISQDILQQFAKQYLFNVVQFTSRDHTN
jgi:hypothetical protein